MARQKHDLLKLLLTVLGAVACIIIVARARFAESNRQNEKAKETAREQANKLVEEEYRKALQENNKLNDENNKLDDDLKHALGGQSESTHPTTLPATREDVIILDKKGLPLTRATWQP